MASPSRTAEREEERRHNLRTLVVASLASATAALLVSQLWIAGTWIAAALTPVLVTLVSELLQRPTERIARGITTGREALPERAPREPGAPAGRAEPPVRGPGSEAPVRVYRSGASGVGPRSRRRKIAYGAVLGTAALAFVIAVIAVTVPELVAGGSVGKNDSRTTFFSGDKSDGNGKREQQTPQDTAPDDDAQPETQQTQPQSTTPDEEQSTTTTTEEEQPTTTTEEPPPAGEPLPRQVPPAEQP
jgi:hypothetical protein